MATCRECGELLLRDVEPQRGVCGQCSPTETSTPTRQRALRRTKKGALLVKKKHYTCQQCGVTGIQPRRGKPRTYCPRCSTSTARRHRAQARS
jgi:DNA-directed RNA polymerase subunit M/transcription elongation factor TFIIS